MPKHRPVPDPPSRYSLDGVRHQIIVRLRLMGRGSQAKLARDLGLKTPQELTKRLNGQQDLTVAWIGAIADRLQAPPGWPFLPWDVAEAAFGKRAK